jgi:hemoglobin/transferrin/lactoferrin receptor protein
VCALWLIPAHGWAAEEPAKQDEVTTQSEAPPGQAAKSDKPLQVGPVTISATKTERYAIETPGEVSVITQEDLRKTQAQSLNDVLRLQPGVDSQLGPRLMGESPNIRGLSDDRVLMILDGARMDFQSGHKGRVFFDVDQLKQVEVLRGPASALYGSQALGGVVVLTTKDPSDFIAPGKATGLFGKIGYQGVNDEWLYSGTAAAKIGPNVEFMANYVNRAGEDIRLGGDFGRLRNSANDLSSGLGKLVWRLGQFDTLKASVQATHEAAQIPGNTNSAITSPASVNDRLNRTMTYRLNYAHKDPNNPWFNFEGNLYHTSLNITEFRLTDRRRDDINFDTTGFDLHNSSSFGNPASMHHRITYGFEYFNDSQEGARGSGALQLFPDANMSILAPYAQDEILLFNRITLIPGVRWDRWSQNAGSQADRSANRANPKVGAVIEAIPRTLYLTANYAEGFRVPRFQELFISGTHFPGAVFLPNSNLQPERSRNIDAGVRFVRDRVLGEADRLIVKGNYFRNTLRDFIDFKIVSAFPQLQFQAVNVTDAVIQGWESELDWQAHPLVRLYGNYFQTHGTNETTSLPLTNIPQKRGVIGVDVYLPWDLTVGLRSTVTGDQNRAPAGVRPTGGYTTFDVYLTYRPEQVAWLKGVRVDAGIDNFTDRDYRRHLSGLPAAGMNPKITVSYTASVW